MLGAALLMALVAAPPPPSPPLTIVAHRRLAEGVPENTLAAFQQSIDRGVAVVELDLRITRDGHLVILHDQALDRTTDCTGLAADMDLAEIRTCDAGQGQRIPTLAEVLALVRGTPVRVVADVKRGTPLAPVLDAVREQRAERQVILGLRSVRQVTRARATLPAATILAYLPDIGDAAEFAAAGADIIRLWSDWAEADPALVARIRALGPQVWVMVGRRLPKRERDWRALHARMIAAGAQGLITDRPDLISVP